MAERPERDSSAREARPEQACASARCSRCDAARERELRVGPIAAGGFEPGAKEEQNRHYRRRGTVARRCWRAECRSAEGGDSGPFHLLIGSQHTAAEEAD